MQLCFPTSYPITENEFGHIGSGAHDIHVWTTAPWPASAAHLGFTLHEHVLEEVVEVLLHLLVGDVGQVTAVRGLGRVLRVHVQVLQHDRLAEGGLVVQPRAALAVTTRADLEVEGAVDSADIHGLNGIVVCSMTMTIIAASRSTTSFRKFGTKLISQRRDIINSACTLML